MIKKSQDKSLSLFEILENAKDFKCCFYEHINHVDNSKCCDEACLCNVFFASAGVVKKWVENEIKEWTADNFMSCETAINIPARVAL